MGCFSGRPELSAEEATSYNLDILLGYYKTPASKVYRVHLKNSTEGLVSEKQFQNISDKLELFELNRDHIQPILNFYTEFKSDISHYSLEKLAIFSVIQSSGNDEEKAEILFNVFSRGNQELKKEEMISLIDFILELFISMLTKLKINDFVNNVSQHDMAKYSSKLRTRKEQARDEIIKTYFEFTDSLTEKEFVEITKKSYFENIFTGHGIRKFLKKSIKKKN